MLVVGREEFAHVKPITYNEAKRGSDSSSGSGPIRLPHPPPVIILYDHWALGHGRKRSIAGGRLNLVAVASGITTKVTVDLLRFNGRITDSR